jgi:dihydrodipicolinate synthase/N-acetylneuraminate lyase
MLTAREIGGVLGMMPAFATPDAVDIRATQTIAVDNLREGVDKIIKDGVNNIATTGTYGECYNLLFDEFKTLSRQLKRQKKECLSSSAVPVPIPAKSCRK